MKKFIILTGVTGRVISIPVDSIVSIEENRRTDCSDISTIYDTEWHVKESVKQIVDKINN